MGGKGRYGGLTNRQRWQWRERRIRYYATHKRICRVCRSTRLIELHHLRYTTFGREPDRDLVPLCRTHHLSIHRYAYAHPKLTLRKATALRIAQLKRMRKARTARRRRMMRGNAVSKAKRL